MFHIEHTTWNSRYIRRYNYDFVLNRLLDKVLYIYHIALAIDPFLGPCYWSLLPIAYCLSPSWVGLPPPPPSTSLQIHYPLGLELTHQSLSTSIVDTCSIKVKIHVLINKKSVLFSIKKTISRLVRRMLFLTKKSYYQEEHMGWVPAHE